jgi:flagellar biosynthetic protein FliR
MFEGTTYLVFLLVMVRFFGVLILHPMFSRPNVPRMALAGLAFFLALLVSGIIPRDGIVEVSMPLYLIWVVKELLVGMTGGFIIRMFMSALLIAGSSIDMQIGISMSQAFDPGSNSSISMSAQFLNLMYYMTFFITGGHLYIIRLTVQSFTVLPVGTYLVNTDAFYVIPELFTNILLLGLFLATPMIVLQIIITFAVGIIMRVVPQINVFVLNIQIKLTIGILVLAFLVPPMMGFIENLIQICSENVQSYWANLMLTP